MGQFQFPTNWHFFEDLTLRLKNRNNGWFAVPSKKTWNHRSPLSPWARTRCQLCVYHAGLFTHILRDNYSGTVLMKQPWSIWASNGTHTIYDHIILCYCRPMTYLIFQLHTKWPYELVKQQTMKERLYVGVGVVVLPNTCLICMTWQSHNARCIDKCIPLCVNNNYMHNAVFML